MKKIGFIVLICTLAFVLTISIGINSAIAAEKDKYGGILRVNHGKQAGVIGEPLAIRAWNHEYVDFVLQTIIRRNPKEFGVYDPELALSWKVTPEKSNVVFKLRKGVKFHDGTDFNAQAAKWNLDRWIVNPKPQFSKMTSIEIIDDSTIRANFSEWDAVTMYDFSRFTFFISPTAFEKNGAEWVKYNPVGTGAFKVTKTKRNTYVRYEKFADYWEKGLPYLDGVEFTMIPDPMTAAASLRRGEVHAMLAVDPVTGTDFRKSGGFDVVTNPGLHQVLYFNSENPGSVWSEQKNREALEYAINKKQIADVIMRGFSFPVDEILHSINLSAPAAGKKVGTVPRNFSPEKARQLLKEAGYPNGLKVKIIYNATAPAHKSIFLAVQDNLKNVGIEAIPSPLLGAALHEKEAAPLQPNELIIASIRGGSVASLPSIKEAFHPKSIYFQGVKKPEGFTGLIDKATQTFDPGKQLDILIEMEQKAYGMAMLTPIMGNYFIAIQNPMLKDAVWFYGGSPIPSLRRTWMSEK